MPVLSCFVTYFIVGIVTRLMPATLCLSVLLFLLGLSTFLLNRSKSLAIVCFVIIGLVVSIASARKVVFTLGRKRRQPDVDDPTDGFGLRGRPRVRGEVPPAARRSLGGEDPETDPSQGPDTDGAGGGIRCRSSYDIQTVVGRLYPWCIELLRLS